MKDHDREQIRQDIGIIENNIGALDAKYTDFFDYHTIEEPKQLRFQTERLIGEWRGRFIPDSVLQFKFHNLLHRYNMNKEKWDRSLTKKFRKERGLL